MPLVPALRISPSLRPILVWPTHEFWDSQVTVRPCLQKKTKHLKTGHWNSASLRRQHPPTKRRYQGLYMGVTTYLSRQIVQAGLAMQQGIYGTILSRGRADPGETEMLICMRKNHQKLHCPYYYNSFSFSDTKPTIFKKYLMICNQDP